MRSYEFPGRKLLSVVVALALSPPASAIEIVKSSVEAKDGRYVMLGESIITAPHSTLPRESNVSTARGPRLFSDC